MIMSHRIGREMKYDPKIIRANSPNIARHCERHNTLLFTSTLGFGRDRICISRYPSQDWFSDTLSFWLHANKENPPGVSHMDHRIFVLLLLPAFVSFAFYG
jgi:hypothetical protein